MTPVEIAYFKHFMYDKSLERSFLYYYRKNRIIGSPRGDKDANPESIEQFFLQTTVEDVIMKAFTFYPSGTATRENSTFDYWKNVDDQWQVYMRSMASNFSNDSWPLLRKSFAILRQNWDVPVYYKKENLESTEEVYKRMNIDLPLPEFCWEHGYIQKPREDAELIKFNIQDAKDGDVIVRIKKLDGGHILRLFILFRELIPYELDGVQMQRALAYAYYNNDTKRLKIAGETHPLLVNSKDNEVSFRLAFPEERNILMDKLADAGLIWSETEKSLVAKNEEEPATAPECPAIPSQEESEQPLIDFSEKDDPLADFEIINSPSLAGCRLGKDEASLNFNNNTYKVTFNAHVSDVIISSKMNFAKLARNKNGDICIIMNKKGGARLSKATKSKRKSNSVTINSKEIATNIKHLFGIRIDYSVLNIEQLNSTSEYLIYKITKARL